MERERVVPALLDLFAEFEVPATWCIVGHLFLERCQPENGVAHPEIVRPRYPWRSADWFDHDRGGDERSQPLHCAASLVRRIRECPVAQEIGSHSFSHVIFGEPGCSKATAESEVAACRRAAEAWGLSLRSFVFPRNSVGHLDVLRAAGFTCFRGPEPGWQGARDAAPGPWRRLARLLDVLRASEPPAVTPRLTGEGLVDVPGSMIYFPSHGVRRFVPIERRVTRARKGLDAAARTRRVFHLWFHPTNLAERTDDMLAGLRAILEHAARLRAEGRLDYLAMGGIADSLLGAASRA